MPQKYIDLTGQVFAGFTVVAKATRRANNTYWTARCECGVVMDVRTDHLRSGRMVSCGCWRTRAKEARRRERWQAAPTGAAPGLDDPRVPARLWGSVVPEPNTSCWLWTGCVYGPCSPYGKCRLFGKSRRAHRAFYQLLIGPVPAGLVLDHLCRTPCCVNPTHLEPVTVRENTMRGLSGRLRKEGVR